MTVINSDLLKQRLSNGKPVIEDSFRTLIDSSLFLEATQQGLGGLNVQDVSSNTGLDIIATQVTQTKTITINRLETVDISSINNSRIIPRFYSQTAVTVSGSTVFGNIVNLSANAVSIETPYKSKKMTFRNRTATSVDISPPPGYRIETLATGSAYTMGTNTSLAIYLFSTAKLGIIK